LGEDPALPAVQQVQAAIRRSPRVAALLALRDAAGHIPHHPYAKWYGAHWVLAALADIGYPPGDAALIPLREDVLAWLLGEAHRRGIKTIEGRTRRCASQEGYAVYYLLKLGLYDARVDELAARLCQWQWPDGGWNCDKHPAAAKSSFMESLIPLRGLALHAQVTGSRESQDAAARAAEVFLKRRLYKRMADGTIMRPDFVVLHYPCYWHYDILFGLKVMAEAGLIHDPRCQDALNLLESKRLADGGFPAEQRYYRTTGSAKTGYSPVDWGGTSVRKLNEWVTVDALSVLRAAGKAGLPADYAQYR
jgi:hypothetical protein